MNTSSPDSLPLSPDASGLTAAEHADLGGLFAQAIELTRREGRLCIASLEQHLDVGHCRAIRIADALERLGHIPPQVLKRRRARFQPLAA